MGWKPQVIPEECLTIHGEIHAEDVESFYGNESINYSLFHYTYGFPLFVIVLPCFAVFGIVVNLFAILVYGHPQMRGFCSLILKSIFFTDSVYLLTLVVCMTPRKWLYSVYADHNYDRFWNLLDIAQQVFIAIYPVHHQVTVLSEWYVLMLVLEQWAVYAAPEKLANISKGQNSIKVIITLLNASVLAHLLMFFKFTRIQICIWQTGPDFESPKLYPTKMVCMSAIYKESGYALYEDYIYIIFFKIVPWCMTLIGIVMCSLAHRDSGFQFPDMDLNALRTFKSGRSVRLVIIVASVFLFIKFFVHVAQWVCMHRNDVKYSDRQCSLSPMDVSMAYNATAWVFVYTFGNVMSALVKPWICFYASRECKDLLQLFCAKQRVMWRDIGRKIVLVLDCSRPTPPKEELSTVEDNQLEGSGSAAPYDNGVLCVYENNGQMVCIYDNPN